MLDTSKIKMNGGELSEREKFVLGTIVEEFVDKAAPVGSKYLKQKRELSLSPATIRTVMMDLEEKGYLEQPHTSAGRVPTDKGYRYYVNSLMRVENLVPEQKNKIVEALSRVSHDIEYILEAASNSLAMISNQLGVVLAPKFYQGVFEKMELVPLTESQVLVVIRIKSGLVKTITLEIEKRMSRYMIEEVARIINERLQGLTLKEVKHSIDRRLRDISLADFGIIDGIIQSSQALFSFYQPSDLHIGGTRNIMAQPEFLTESILRKLMGLIDDKSMLLHVFDAQDEEDKLQAEAREHAVQQIRIAIGEENREALLRHCSIITANYSLGEISGTLGVLGPTRIDYSKMVALVSFMSEVLSEILNPNLSKKRN